MTRRRPAILHLAIAAVLLLVANGRDTVTVAAWLAPIFLLRAFRLLGPWAGTPLAGSVLVLTWAFQWRGMVPVGTGMFWMIDGAYAAAGLLPFLVDSWVTPRWSGPGLPVLARSGRTPPLYLESLEGTAQHSDAAQAAT